MRLGLLGGSFDPIHLGHLRAAEVAREELGLDRVIFVPAGTPPHRPALASSARDRFAMVALATSSHSAFSPSDIELKRSGPSYTIETLRALEPQADDRIALILGSDAYAEFEGWRESERIRELAELVVVRRPGAPEAPGTGARWLSEPGLPISASAIRAAVQSGRSPRYLVPSGVADYIAKRELYR